MATVSAKCIYGELGKLMLTPFFSDDNIREITYFIGAGRLKLGVNIVCLQHYYFHLFDNALYIYKVNSLYIFSMVLYNFFLKRYN